MYKLTNLALAMLMMLLLAACGNDDETTSNNELEDTWTLLTVDLSVGSDTEVSGQTVMSNVEATGANPAYDLTLDGGQWTTEGGYEMAVSATVDGMAVSSSTDSYDNVMGSGTYTTDANTITVDGSFFEFEYNGVNLTSGSGDTQTANYNINSDDQLVISQNETSSSTSGGVTTTSTVVSTSVWERK